MALVLGSDIAVIGPGFNPRDIFITGMISGPAGKIDIELLRGEAWRVVIEVFDASGQPLDMSAATGAALTVAARPGAAPVLDWRLGDPDMPLIFSAPNRLVAELSTERGGSVPARIYRVETFVSWASGSQFTAAGLWRHVDTLTRGA